MKKNLKFFKTHAEYQTYINGNKTLPNVSYCEDKHEVHYNPGPDKRFIAKFNISDTTNSTQIINSSATSQFSEVKIDGIVQQSVTSTYQFDSTGEHIIKYTIANPTTIGNSAFQNCTNLTGITIPNTVTTIGFSAFQGCTGLTDITIPSNVTTIQGGAFQNCTGLVNVELSNGILGIGQATFSYCTGLTSVTIPNSVTTIGGTAFNGCTNLTNVTIEATTPPNIENEVFNNNASGRKIYVPAESVDTYKAARGWSNYASDIEAIPTT